MTEAGAPLLPRLARRLAALDSHPQTLAIACLALVVLATACLGALPGIGHATLAWRLGRLAGAAMVLWFLLHGLCGLCAIWKQGRDAVARWGRAHGHPGLEALWDRAWVAALRRFLGALDVPCAAILLAAATATGFGAGLLTIAWRVMP